MLSNSDFRRNGIVYFLFFSRNRSNALSEKCCNVVANYIDVDQIGAKIPDNADEANDTVKTFHPIRSMNEARGLYIVKLFSRGHFSVFTLPSTYPSKSAQAAKHRSPIYLSLLSCFTLAGLNLVPTITWQDTNLVRPTSLRWSMAKIIPGHDHEMGSQCDGKTFGIAMIDGHNYWPGWRALCGRTEQAISPNKLLTAVREKMRNFELR